MPRPERKVHPDQQESATLSETRADEMIHHLAEVHHLLRHSGLDTWTEARLGVHIDTAKDAINKLRGAS